MQLFNNIKKNKKKQPGIFNYPGNINPFIYGGAGIFDFSNNCDIRGGAGIAYPSNYGRNGGD